MISPADDASPVTMARMTGTELLRSLRAEADRLAALGTGLRDRIDTLADPTAAEVEAVRAAQQRAATAEARAAAAKAGQFRAEADAAVAQAERDTAHAQAAAHAARAETEPVRADAGRVLGQACAEAVREREELRARAERAEQQADAYRDELTWLRAASPEPGPAESLARPARRGTRAGAARSRRMPDQ